MENRRFAIGLAFAAACAACGPDGDDDDDDACAGGFAAGDLVISEIQADLAGVDDGKEWFEVYNAGSAAADLTGLTLVHAKDDMTGQNTYEVPGGQIPAGGYFVFGGVLDEFKPDYVDHGYADNLGDLRNTSGLLALRCGAAEIDATSYAAVSEGASRTLDGGAAPDYLANDDDGNWCDGRSDYGIAGESGTPGAANDGCGAATTCLDGGSARATVPPMEGDVVITELMPDPTVAGSDGEWFELFVVANVDLNGLQLGNDPGTVEETLSDANCLSIAAGTYVVFAKQTDPAINGMIDEDFSMGSVGLANSGGSLFVGVGGQVLDQVTWPSARDAKSLSLDPDFLDPGDNDNPANWCDGTTAIGNGDLGTPGAANDFCPLAGKCLDGAVRRNTVVPGVGDLVITEFLADPNVIGDPQGEWFEVYAVNAVDLNDLEIGRTIGTPDATIASGTCLAVAAGSYTLFARVADPAINGGLPTVDHTFNFALTNDAVAGVTLFVGAAGIVVDSITWTTTNPGDSRQLDPDSLDASLNDNANDPLFWCPGVTPYGTGDNRGTPAAANAQCP
jgi:hypothetical protein